MIDVISIYLLHIERSFFDVVFVFLFLNIVFSFYLFVFVYLAHCTFKTKQKIAHKIPSCAMNFAMKLYFYRVKWVWYDIIIELFRNRLI